MQIGFAQANQKLLECKSEIIATVGAKVDAVASKVKRGSRRGRYTEAQIDFCGKVWESACDIQEIRNSTNTKVSYEAAFQFFHRQLAKLGVESVDDFKSIIRAHQARELRRRQREKSAAKPCTQRGKYGIMRDVKSHAKSALALTLAIAGGLAASLRSDASVRKGLTPPPRSGVTLSAASYALRSAVSDALHEHTFRMLCVRHFFQSGDFRISSHRVM